MLVLVLADAGHTAGLQLQLVLVEVDGGLGIVVVPLDQLQLKLLHGTSQHDVEELDVAVVSGLDLPHQLDVDGVLRLVLVTHGGQHDVAVIRGHLGGGEQLGAIKHELGQSLLHLRRYDTGNRRRDDQMMVTFVISIGEVKSTLYWSSFRFQFGFWITAK